MVDWRLQDDPEDELNAIAREIVRSESLSRGRPPLALDLLRAAIALTKADMGNIQLVEKDRLKIVAHIGFEKPFLDCFAAVDGHHCACGAAMKRGRRVVVEDVAKSAIYGQGPELWAMLEAGARSVQSTPLVSNGRVIGMLSTHCHKPRRLTSRDCRVLDIIAGLAVQLLS